jgi:hypothetical protein
MERVMDPVYTRVLEWLERRVRAAEVANPRLRLLKDEIEHARIQYEGASTDDARRVAFEAQERACRALLEESLK